MSDKPKFPIKSRGYDRFSVDNYIHELEHDLEFATSKLEVYRKQLDFLTEQLEATQHDSLEIINRNKVLEIEKDQLEALYTSIVNNVDAVNADIEKAQESADQIILEALMVAQEVLEVLNETTYTTKDIRMELLDDLYRITNTVIDMDTEEPLIIEWLNKNK